MAITYHDEAALTYIYIFHIDSGTITTLDGDHSSSIKTIVVADTTGFPDSGYIQIDNEWIYYTSKTATQFNVYRRAEVGTAGATHSNGTTVTNVISSANRPGSSAFDYFNDSAVVGDLIIFTVPVGGRYDGIKFYVGTALVADAITLEWDYYGYTGGGGGSRTWYSLSNVVDNTTNFTVLGENLVTWDPVEVRDWNNKNDCALKNHWEGMMFAVRCRVTAVTNITEGGAQSTQTIKRRLQRIRNTSGSAGTPCLFTDIYDEDQAQGWGLVTKSGVEYPQFHLNCDFENQGHLSSQNEQIHIDGHYMSTSGSYAYFGKLLANGCARAGSQLFFFNLRHTSKIYGTNTWYDSKILWKALSGNSLINFYTNNTFQDSIVELSPHVGDCRHYAYDISSWKNTRSVNAIFYLPSFTSLDIDGLSVEAAEGMAGTAVMGFECGKTTSAIAKEITIKGDYKWIYLFSGVFLLRNSDLPSDESKWYGRSASASFICTLYDQKSLNLKVTDKDGNAFQNVIVKVWDKNNNLVTVHDSGANTAEALDNSETVIDVTDNSVFSDGDIIRINAEYMLITNANYGANQIEVTRGYYTDLPAEYASTGQDIFIVGAETDVDGKIEEQFFNVKRVHRNETGDGCHFKYYNDYIIKLSKAGYETYGPKKFTINKKIDWTIKLKHSNVCVDQEVMLA